MSAGGCGGPASSHKHPTPHRRNLAKNAPAPWPGPDPQRRPLVATAEDDARRANATARTSGLDLVGSPHAGFLPGLTRTAPSRMPGPPSCGPARDQEIKVSGSDGSLAIGAEDGTPPSRRLLCCVLIAFTITLPLAGAPR